MKTSIMNTITKIIANTDNIVSNIVKAYPNTENKAIVIHNCNISLFNRENRQNNKDNCKPTAKSDKFLKTSTRLNNFYDLFNNLRFNLTMILSILFIKSFLKEIFFIITKIKLNLVIFSKGIRLLFRNSFYFDFISCFIKNCQDDSDDKSTNSYKYRNSYKYE